MLSCQGYTTGFIIAVPPDVTFIIDLSVHLGSLQLGWCTIDIFTSHDANISDHHR